MRRDNFELVDGAFPRPLVFAPSAELSSVTEASCLHVIVCDLKHKLGTQRFPRHILALTPSALPTGAAMRIGFGRLTFCPGAPWMLVECINAIRLEKIHELFSFQVCKARAHTDVLEVVAVLKTENERSNRVFLAAFVPAKSGDDTIAIALVPDLQHSSLVGLVRPGLRFCDDAVEPARGSDRPPRR